MRVISKPTISPLTAYTACYSSFRDATTKTKFSNINNFIDTQSNQYEHNANSKNLYTFMPHIHVSGTISKDDMITLYDNNMVKNKEGRNIYDQLLSLAPLSRCPYCGIGQVSTLDHYLPKTEFPTFSVLPYNLVASCKDCNTGKLASYATTQNTQTLHPYYDNFTIEQWLFARVLQTSPVSIEFYVNPPATWNQVDKDRVQSHFDNYKLNKRFSSQAASVLAYLRDKFLQYFSNPIDIANELERDFNINRNIHLNSWETAMYQALYRNPWYCNGGFR
jgi:hypothetical protein